MQLLKKSISMRVLAGLHFALMVGLFVTCWTQFYRLPVVQGEYFVHDRTICAAYFLMLFALSRIYNCYKVGLYRVGELVYNQILANLISWGITYILACIMLQGLINPIAGFMTFLAQSCVGVGLTLLMNRLFFRINKPRKTAILYRNENDLSKLEEVKYFEHKWKVIKRICCMDKEDDKKIGGKRAVYLNVPDIHDIIAQIRDCETVFISGVSATLRNGIVKYCVEADKDCYFVPHTGDVIVSGAKHIRSFAVPICRAQRCMPTPEYLFVKRMTDIVVSSLALVALAPVMLITAIAIKAYDNGPVFYKQTRLTKDGKEFQILKYRSMCPEAEKDGIARLASENDERITPVGRIIRRIRLDELPQLMNILKGDMTIVGPRPERPEIAAQYEEKMPAFGLRLQVKAGLTGYAQIYGRYNTEPSDKLKMDLMYVNNVNAGHGITEDLKLIFATVSILFMKSSTSGVNKGKTTAVH